MTTRASEASSGLNKAQNAAIRQKYVLVATLPRSIRQYVCELYQQDSARRVAELLQLGASIALDVCDKDIDPEMLLDDAETLEEEIMTKMLMSAPKLTRALAAHAGDLQGSIHTIRNAICAITKEDLPPEEKSRLKSLHVQRGSHNNTFTEKDRKRGRIANKKAIADLRVKSESLRVRNRDWTREQIGHFIVLCTHPDHKVGGRLRQKKIAEKMNEKFPEESTPFTWQHCCGLFFWLRTQTTI